MTKLVMNAHVDDVGHEEPGHPERPDRLTATLAGVEISTWATTSPMSLPTRPPVRNSRACTTVPTSTSWAPFATRVAATSTRTPTPPLNRGPSRNTPPEPASRSSMQLRQSEDAIGFVAARPPGHHALRDRAMGFCLLNNVAVAAASLTAQGERVAIVDWDVHHGNGTQAIFWNDPNVLYVSTHQWPLYPGSGGAREIGGVDALGHTVNIPLPPGATGDVLRRAFDDIAAPLLEAFDPTWVLISAGFDGHRDDPIADLAFSSGDFAHLATTVASFAPPSRLALFLEGGYNLDALRNSVGATLASLLGREYQSEAATNGGAGNELIERTRSEREIALRLAYEVQAAGGNS